MEKLNFQNKSNGDILNASDWNAVTGKVDAIIDAINSGEDGSGGGTPVIVDSSGILSTSSKGNVTVGSGKNINIEPAWNNNDVNYSGNEGDIAFKPGDDIQFCSHHRAFNKRDKIVIKNIDGDDNPVKSQIVAGEIELAVGTQKNPKSATFKKNKTTGQNTEDKLFKAGDAKTLDVKILTGTVLDEGTEDERDERGYLKVRAQAIDLRCEKHGGIALQPKGYDSEGNMNKIKFEHGGGDGLEFGTFNTQKTSIFTDEYRFNKSGIWKMSNRFTETSGKAIVDERENGLQGLPATALLKYKKNNSTNNAEQAITNEVTYEAADDFYDFIDVEDAQTTTEAIIQTSAALNNEFIKTSLSAKKNAKIIASSTYKIVALEIPVEGTLKVFDMPASLANNTSFTKDDLKLILSGSTNLSSYIKTSVPFKLDAEEATQYVLIDDITPKISVEAEEEVDLSAKYGDIVLSSGDCIKCEAPEIRLNALNEDKSGGTVNFGATQDIIFITKKLTNGLKVEAPSVPTKIKQVLQNNTSQTVLWNGSKFILTLKELYGKDDNNQLIKVTPSNYSTFQGKNAYFSDGSAVPADYTCYCGFTTEESSVYTTTIYAMGTKGSSQVFKKNIGNPVAIYTHSQETVLGNTRTVAANSSDSNYTYIKGMNYLEFIFEAEESSMSSTPGISVVQPDSFVENEDTTINLEDVFTLVNYFKSGAGQANGPWAPQL